MLVNRASAFLQKFQRLTNLAASNRRRTDNKRAIGDSLADCGEYLRVREQLGRPHSRPRLKKRRLVRIHEMQPEEPKVTHRSRDCADVEWIACGHQYDADALEIVWYRQDEYFSSVATPLNQKA